jgi:hypothetical protein
MPTPAKNRFEQVDFPQPDALNLVLTQTAARQDGRVFVPEWDRSACLPSWSCV